MHSYEAPVYMISVVAELLDIHPQTLRQYEREGLVAPSRSGGKIRLYSQKDIDEIKMILRLTRDLGVNLAGVDVVLQMRGQIKELEREIVELKDRINMRNEHGVVPNNKAVVCSSTRRIVIIEEN